jgi:hypothetical protein
MPDITMCEGVLCPHKENCYRFTATPSEFRQSYFLNVPIQENGKCDYYWGENAEAIWNQLNEIVKGKS